ncbi:hypothetical protein EDB84DRAFT_1567519 [Lactarius hengduanensis]|nr:hypothetical protein EDB84DRAFT_1567519 [Lactarius hengduanensis]
MSSDFGLDSVPSLTPAASLSALGLTRRYDVNKTDIETLRTSFGADTAQMAPLPDFSLKKVTRLKDVRVALPYTPSMAYARANEVLAVVASGVIMT